MSKQGEGDAERRVRDEGGGRFSTDSYSDRVTGSPGPGSGGGPGSGTWSPRGSGRTFNPSKSRFNPNRTFNFSDTRSNNNSHGPSLSTPFQPGGTGSPADGKRFNPRSTFSPGVNLGVGANQGSLSANSAPVASQGGLVDPNQPPEQIASYSDLVQYNRLAPDYTAMYHPPMHPLQYHLYAPPPFRLRPMLSPHERLAEDLFLSNDLREELLQRNEAALQVLPASSLPEFVHVYHSLVPLDTHVGHSERFGYPTWRYKAVSNTDGRTYCLMRVEGFHLTQEKAMVKVNKWSRVSSAGVVGVVEAFTTLAFGDYSLVLVYEYFPLAQSVEEAYTAQVHEGLWWSLAAQLFAAVHAAHKNKLAIRSIDPKSVLVTQRGRVRFGSVAVIDVIEYEEKFQEHSAASNGSSGSAVTSAGSMTNTPSTPGTPGTPRANPPIPAPSTPGGSYSFGMPADDSALLQRQDWNKLGDLLLGIGNPKKIWSMAESKYSPDVMAFIKALQDEDVTPEKLVPLISPHLFKVLDGSLAHNDELEDTLARELENARLVRLLSKIEFVIDRPENINSPRWAPTGDRYMLKLLKDYVFHQVDEQGTPSLDLAHVLATLNKLDAGIDESVLLVSPDEQTRIIVTYQDLKTAIDQAFRELHPRTKR